MKIGISTLIILVFTGFSFILNGQAPSWVWATGAGGAGGENGNSTADALGNVYVTGKYTSATITFGTFTLTNSNAGSEDIFLVKYDASGNVLWAKGEGGSGNDFSISIDTDASGNVFVTGGYASSAIIIGADTLTNSGSTDILIIKYDATGNVLWAMDEGGTGTEDGQSIAVDASGNVCITGAYTSGNFTIGTTTLTNTSGFGGAKVFIVKYDAAGNVLWVKSAGGNVFDNRGQGITTDASGNVYVIGYFDYPSISFGSITVQNSGGIGQLFDMFLVKYDPLGNVLWAKGAGASSSDQRGLNTTTDSSGNVIVTGYYKSSMTFGTITLANAAGINMFVAKYDSLGNVLWAKSAGGAFDDYGRSATTDASGNVYVTGYYSSPTITFGATAVTNGGGWGSTFDMFLVKYDASGNVLWVMDEGGASSDLGSSAIIDVFGNVYVSGNYSSSSITFGSTTLTNGGGADMFIAKLGTTTSIENITSNTVVSVYPNPTTGLLYLSENYNITLLDVTGKLISKEQSTNTIDISNQPAGMYFLELTDNKGQIIQRSKVMKE